jgi:hypothetical protein
MDVDVIDFRPHYGDWSVVWRDLGCVVADRGCNL